MIEANLELATALLRSCAGAGVREIVLCAGARNAPLVLALSRARGVRVHHFFEERSAAFFALGRIQATGRPVAVITTSGTACAELLPAAVEADHQGAPLILLTADRPRAYRGSGAPQVIVQPGLFSSYVEKSWDIEGEWRESLDWSGRRPIHVNACFDEPLWQDRAPRAWNWPTAETRVRSEPPAEVPMPFSRPLVLVGSLPPAERASVLDRLRQWRRPAYIEAPSGLRGFAPEIEIMERAVPETEADGIVRVGGVPTLRYWRDLEKSGLPVLNFSHLPFSGLSRVRGVHGLGSLRPWPFEAWSRPAREDQRVSRLDALLERHPQSEPGWLRRLSESIPSDARVFLGNSLPIREWDLAARGGRHSDIFVNRGVNGIDGLVSTFLGVSEPDRPNWALLGDLSTLYDLSGPWALRSRPMNDVNLVVLNNGGGQIFRRIFGDPRFENGHRIRFRHWAELWEMDYLRLESGAAIGSASRPRVIEIVPDADQTESFWREWGARG